MISLAVDGKFLQKPEAHDPLESMEIPTEPTSADTRTDEQRR